MVNLSKKTKLQVYSKIYLNIRKNQSKMVMKDMVDLMVTKMLKTKNKELLESCLSPRFQRIKIKCLLWYTVMKQGRSLILTLLRKVN